MIFVFLLLVVVELGFVLPLFGGSRRSPVVEFHLRETDGGYEMLDHGHSPHRAVETGEDVIVAHAILSTEPGLIWGLGEWSVTRQFNVIREWTYSERGLIDIEDPVKLDRIADKVIAYAKEQDEFAEFRPGSGAWTAFSFGVLARTLWYWILLLVPPLLLTGLMFTLPKVIRAEGQAERVRKGLCAKCGYDRSGIGTHPCPECGAPAGMPGQTAGTISA